MLGPVYNGLAPAPPEPGRMMISFRGYAVPDGTFQYIVKALPATRLGTSDNVLVAFDSVSANGLYLRLTSGGQPAAIDIIKASTFVIEVSRYSA